MNSIPSSYELETRAADERRRLDSSFHELKNRMKEKLDLRRNAEDFARQHTAEASTVAAVLGLILGYNAAGMFTRH
ncbi:MAG TPA: hypothetical protein VFA68_02490 [Terriglobales bacterium]|nr:hypothetical protein [Terriglobales bacterium]